MLVIALACAASPVVADDVARWREPVAEASRRFGIPIAWIEKVMRTESAGRTTMAGRPIVSSAGAMGLMQLMPGTWRDVRGRLGLGNDPHDPRDNILAGTYYLRSMFDQFGYPGLFAAYNAGPARYAAYRAGGRALPRETRDYVVTIAGGLARAGDGEPASARVPPAPPVRTVWGARDATATSGLFFLRRGEDEPSERIEPAEN